MNKTGRVCTCEIHTVAVFLVLIECVGTMSRSNSSVFVVSPQ